MFGKSWEFWAVLVGMAFYVASRDAEKEPLRKRVVKTAASALLAFGLAPQIAPYLGGNEIIAAVAVMGFGLITLDLITAILGDGEFIKDLIRRKIGGSGGSGGPYDGEK